MDWFSERKVSVLEAFTLRRVLATSLIFSIGGSAVTIVPLVFNGARSVLGIAGYGWGIIAGLIAVAYFLLEYATRLRVALVPKFVVTFDALKGGIVFTPALASSREIGEYSVTQKSVNQTYVRIHVSALTKAVVNNCSAFITGITKCAPGAAPTEIPINYAVPLGVAAVIPGIAANFDFLVAQDKPARFGVSVEAPLALLTAFADSATYTFTILVHAGNASETIKVAVQWTGRWDHISANRVVAA